MIESERKKREQGKKEIGKINDNKARDSANQADETKLVNT